jgi:hypothetical protein
LGGRHGPGLVELVCWNGLSAHPLWDQRLLGSLWIRRECDTARQNVEGLERSKAAGVRILGVNIAAGTAYMVLVETPSTVLVEEVERLKPATHLAGAAEARDFHDRFLQDLRRLRATAVAVAYVRKHANWNYKEAFARVMVETCIMLAATEHQIPFHSVGPEAASKVVGVPLDSLQTKLAPKLGITPGKYWKERCLALAVALAAAEGRIR